MKLFLCRHGETVDNAKNLIQGQTSSKINEKGFEQIEKLKEELSDHEISAVYSSTMNRAIKTAVEVAEPHSLDVEESDMIMEVNRSKFEGQKFEDLLEEINNSEKEDYLWKPEGGENLEELKERVTTFLNTLKDKHEDEKVVVISHGGTIGAAIMGVIGHSAKNSYKFIQHNCAINELQWDQSRGWQILTVNETCHLKL